MPEVGVSCVSADKATVTAVQLHSLGHEGHSQFAGVLPSNLEFSMSRPQVRALLGEPLGHGDAAEIPVLGKKPPWDAFAVGPLRVHVEYHFECGSIQMITLTRLDT